MNTFMAVLAAFIVRDVLFEVYAHLRLRVTRKRLFDALSESRDMTATDWDSAFPSDASLEDLVREQIANTNRTQKD